MTPKIDKWTWLINWANRAAIGAVTREAVLNKMDELDRIEIQLDHERWERTVDSRLNTIERYIKNDIADHMEDAYIHIFECDKSSDQEPIPKKPRWKDVPRPPESASRWVGRMEKK